MKSPGTEFVECDILIIGGGMAGCGAAYEANYWGKGLRVVLVEKAVIERSGATGEGLSAINCYMGLRWGWNTPEDFVSYVRNDMMGLAREDLVYDVGAARRRLRTHVGRVGPAHLEKNPTALMNELADGRYLYTASPSSRSLPSLPERYWAAKTFTSGSSSPIFWPIPGARTGWPELSGSA